jgi:hypothetical protein
MLLHPQKLAVKANSKDTPTWNEAISGPDKQINWLAMEK